MFQAEHSGMKCRTCSLPVSLQSRIFSIAKISLISALLGLSGFSRLNAAVALPASPCTLGWNQTQDASIAGYVLYYGITGSTTNRQVLGLVNDRHAFQPDRFFKLLFLFDLVRCRRRRKPSLQCSQLSTAGAVRVEAGLSGSRDNEPSISRRAKFDLPGRIHPHAQSGTMANSGQCHGRFKWRYYNKRQGVGKYAEPLLPGLLVFQPAGVVLCNAGLRRCRNDNPPVSRRAGCRLPRAIHTVTQSAAVADPGQRHGGRQRKRYDDRPAAGQHAEPVLSRRHALTLPTPADVPRRRPSSNARSSRAYKPAS